MLCNKHGVRCINQTLRYCANKILFKIKHASIKLYNNYYIQCPHNSMETLECALIHWNVSP